MLPEKFKAIIKKKNANFYTYLLFLLYMLFTPLNILPNRFYENVSSYIKCFPMPFLLQVFPLFSPLLAYSFSSKNEAVEINYKA